MKPGLGTFPEARRGGAAIGRGYSRFVFLSKCVLPATAAMLMLLVAAWPRLQSMMETIRLAAPRLDLSEARDLHMSQVRYAGIDRENRPFVITADVARQKPNVEGLIMLDRPRGDLTTLSGNWLELSGDTGLYQQQPQLLDLYGNVALFQDKGNEFHSESAHIDMAAGTVEGDTPIAGQGPFGTVTAQGYRILDRGADIIFQGHAKLDILSSAKEKQ